MTVTASEVLSSLFGGKLPVGLRAWDGSTAGQDDCPKVVVTRRALRRLLWNLSELGLARAYVSGDLDVEGDLTEGLRLCWQFFRSGQLDRPSLREVARAAVRLRVIGPRPRPPAEEARPAGRLHTRARDKSVIAHHYDLGNDFYQLILDPSMAYSCAYFGDDRPGTTQSLESAQRAKLDLVCRKLDLGPGSRLLDVGCGWGSLSLHAAEEFGAQVVGVTIAAEQKAFVDERIAQRGLGARVEIRLQDYREVPATDDARYDAVASLEMGEHVGERNYPAYVDALRRAVRPGGRVLVQQMSRTGRHPGGGPFIESFIAPDMHMRPVGETVAFLERGGLEVRDVHAMREHYVRTVAGWLENFELHLPELTALVGEEVVRVWRLYLVGGALAFRDGRMGVDQILCVRPGADHSLPVERAW